MVGVVGRGAGFGALLGLLTGTADIVFLLAAVGFGGGVEDCYVVDLVRALSLYALIGSLYGAAAGLLFAPLAATRRIGAFVGLWIYAAAVAVRTVQGPALHGSAAGTSPPLSFHLSTAVLAAAFAPTIARRFAGPWARSLVRGVIVFAAFAIAAVIGVARERFELPALVAREIAAIPATARGETGVATDATRRPNILLLTIDTLRADRLGAYGSSAGLTPALDKLAAESIVFENVLAQSSWTRPSFGSIFTSRYPSAHEATWRRMRSATGERISIYNRALRPDFPTLAALLDADGYLTVAINTNVQTSITFGFDHGFDHFIDVSRPLSLLTESVACRFAPPSLARVCASASSIPSEYPYLSADRVEEIFYALADRLEQREQPFFLWVHLMDPHVPYRAHDAANTSVGYADIERTLAGPDGRARAQALIENAYSGAVAFADQRAGRIVERLDRAKTLGNTIVLVTSDHGEEILEHWRPESDRKPGLELYYRGYGHGHTMYDELLRVPLILRLPDHRGAGTRATVPAMHVDIAPTLLAAAGVGLAPKGFAPEGRDLLALIESPDQAAQRVLRSEATLYGPEVKQIRAGSQKIIARSADGAEERYDLASDLRETRDIARDATPRFAALERVLGEWRASLPVEPTEPGSAADLGKGDAELGKQLEALGYVE